MRKNEIRLPTLIGVLVALVGLISGVWLVREQVRKSAIAVAEESPKEVKISNTGDSTFTVSWKTGQATTGFIKYGEGQGSLDLVISDERDQQRGTVERHFTHYVSLRGLKPLTKYWFRIGSGDNIYGNGEEAYQVTTAPKLSDPPAADVAYGQVVTEDGDPAEGAIVYLKLAGATLQSALVKPSGTWVIPLSVSRGETLADYVKYDPNSAKYELEIEDGPMGKALAVVNSGNDTPVPNIVLGSNNDFSTADAGKNDQEIISKFSSPTGNLITEDKSPKLAITVPKFGEKINDNTPEIIGTAPAGAKVTVEIHSDKTIKGTVTADKSGNYSFSVPDELPAGEHTVIVSTIINGVVQRVTKTFTVYAAGESDIPSYTATPSATRAPTIKPTATLKPTATIRPTVTPVVKTTVSPTSKPTATMKPSPTVKISLTVTPIDETPKPPVSGNDSETWLMLGLGLGLIISGGWWYRKAM